MNYKKEIVKAINEISGKYSPYQIFRDWCEMYALAIQNACVLYHDELWNQRENTYKGIISKYDEKERDNILFMSNVLPLIYEEEFTDVLGEIYMESGAGNSATGQFFTPFHVSVMMAEMNKSEYTKNGKIELLEPSCGGGGMIIAIAKTMKRMGLNYQSKMKVVAQDLDWLSVYMTYIQLSLLGIDAIVVQGDSLGDPFVPRDYEKRRMLRTPKNTGALF